MSVTDLDRRRLQQILQRLKSLIFSHLDETTRQQIQAQLSQLDEMYTNNQINIDEYKIKSIALLLQFWEPNRREQFLYRETGSFLTDNEKFTLTQFSQKLRD